MTSKKIKKNQKVGCFNYGKPGHLQRYLCKEFLGTMAFFFLRDNPNRDSCLLEYAEGVAKDDIELMNADQHETDKVTLCNALGALSQVPMSNSIM